MLLREVVGRGVFDVAGAQTISKVRTVVVEPSEQRVVGFRIDGPSPILPLRNVKAVGHDNPISTVAWPMSKWTPSCRGSTSRRSSWRSQTAAPT